MKADSASQHRAAGALALGFAAATVVSLAGTFALDARTGVAARTQLERAPDASWASHWLSGAVSAAEQQQAALEQWLQLVVIFGALAFAVAGANALLSFVSHANERRYETALRAIAGASRRQLRRTFLRAAMLNALIGCAFGVPAGVLLARFADREWIVLACAAVFSIAAFAAHRAAARTSRAGWLGDAIAPEARTLPGFGAEDLRTLLTTAQLATAVALTTVSLMVWSYASVAGSQRDARSDRYVARVALPIDTTPEERRALYASILGELRAATDVEAESIASAGALLGIGTVDKVVSDCGACARGLMYTPIFPLQAQQHVAGSGFFRAAGIAMKRGREFQGDARDAGTIIVNALFAREAFMQHDPIGKRVLVGGFEKGRWYTVVGVVEDVAAEGLQLVRPDFALGEAAQNGRLPAIYFSLADHAPAEFEIVVQARQMPLLRAGISFEPLQQVIARANAPQKSFSRVLTMLGVLLGCVAVIATFTATMLSVRSRRAEIAIRRAVGARRRDVWRLVYRQVAAIATRGVLAGLIISVALARALEVFVPGLPLLHVRTATAVALSFFGIAFIAALLPLRAALRIAPATGQD